MPIFDLSLEELRTYRPPLTAEPDLDSFWAGTLAEAKQIPLDATFTPSDYPARKVAVYDVRYNGWDGARIAAWYIQPAGEGPFPAVVVYHGYGGSKGEPVDHLLWTAQGYAVLAVDTRGQSGMSTDPTSYPGGRVKGWMTAGILDLQGYYYRGAYVDCVRALDALAARPEVDMAHVGVTGGSQGGALTLAVAALDRRPALAMPEVPYLCHFQRAVDMAMRHPYLEISDYIRIYPKKEAQVWGTLSYFDNMNLAPRIQCPTLVSVGLIDDICPPSTVFAMYNRLECEKEIGIFRYHNHEGIPAHWRSKLAWAQRYLG